MAKRASIDKQFTPLSDGLLKAGLQRVEATIAKHRVIGNLFGAAANPNYQVVSDHDGKTGTTGPRDHCVDWIYHHQHYKVRKS